MPADPLQYEAAELRYRTLKADIERIQAEIKDDPATDAFGRRLDLFQRERARAGRLRALQQKISDLRDVKQWLKSYRETHGVQSNGSLEGAKAAIHQLFDHVTWLELELIAANKEIARLRGLLDDLSPAE